MLLATIKTTVTRKRSADPFSPQQIKALSDAVAEKVMELGHEEDLATTSKLYTLGIDIEDATTNQHCVTGKEPTCPNSFTDSSNFGTLLSDPAMKNNEEYIQPLASITEVQRRVLKMRESLEQPIASLPGDEESQYFSTNVEESASELFSLPRNQGISEITLDKIIVDLTTEGLRETRLLRTFIHSKLDTMSGLQIVTTTGFSVGVILTAILWCTTLYRGFRAKVEDRKGQRDTVRMAVYEKALGKFLKDGGWMNDDILSTSDEVQGTQTCICPQHKVRVHLQAKPTRQAPGLDTMMTALPGPSSQAAIEYARLSNPQKSVGYTKQRGANPAYRPVLASDPHYDA